MTALFRVAKFATLLRRTASSLEAVSALSHIPNADMRDAVEMTALFRVADPATLIVPR